jgi:hypothetical protein
LDRNSGTKLKAAKTIILPKSLETLNNGIMARFVIKNRPETDESNIYLGAGACE